MPRILGQRTNLALIFGLKGTVAKPLASSYIYWGLTPHFRGWKNKRLTLKSFEDLKTDDWKCNFFLSSFEDQDTWDILYRFESRQSSKALKIQRLKF